MRWFCSLARRPGIFCCCIPIGLAFSVGIFFIRPRWRSAEVEPKNVNYVAKNIGTNFLDVYGAALLASIITGVAAGGYFPAPCVMCSMQRQFPAV
jgi:hypothetical protein